MELEVHIDTLAFGGHGVGRLPSGKVVFVRGGAPQEHVRARVIEERKSYTVTVAEQVLSPSPVRVEPVCAVADDCGGCPWMHLSIEAQRSWKRELLAKELLRAGVIDAVETVAETVSGAELGCRTRCRLHLRGDQFGTLGARSHDVVPLGTCPVLVPQLERFALELKEATSRARLGWAEVELYVDSRDRRGLYVSRCDPSKAKGWEQIAADLEVSAFAIELGRRRRGRPTRGPLLEERSAAHPLSFAPGLFVQSNREMNSRLVEEVLRGAVGCAGAFAEVYSGVGNFTIHLAEQFERGAAFERDRQAVKMLRRNLGDASTRVHAEARSDHEIGERLASMGDIDLLVVDPPRAGMKPLLPTFSPPRAFRPRRIVLVSCHPMSAVRDMAHLVRMAGYRLLSVVPCDLFPQTHHLELVSVLESRPA